jgi:hypothetical protein
MGGYNLADYDIVGNGMDQTANVSTYIAEPNLSEQIEVENLKRLVTPVEPNRMKI